MKISLRYFVIELKRCLKMLGRTWANLLLMLLLLATLTVVAGQALYGGNPFSKISVAVSTPEKDDLTDMLLRFIASMDSVKSVCEFRQMEEGEALDALREGELQAFISLPARFYEDVDSGKNTPAVVYFPKDNGFGGVLFRELLKDGVSMLQTAEAGVYATYACIGDDDQLVIEHAEVGNLLARAYFGAVSDRTVIFDSEVISPFGKTDAVGFYSVAAVLMILMLCGPGLAFLFDKASVSVLQRLGQSGANALMLSFEKTCVMLTGLLLPALIAVALSGKWNYIAHVIVFLFSLSAYFFAIYELAGEGQRGSILLLILSIGQLLPAGVMVPASYLPAQAARLGTYLPAASWFSLLRDIAISEKSITLMPTLGLGLAFFVIGYVVLRRHLAR